MNLISDVFEWSVKIDIMLTVDPPSNAHIVHNNVDCHLLPRVLKRPRSSIYWWRKTESFVLFIWRVANLEFPLHV